MTLILNFIFVLTFASLFIYHTNEARPLFASFRSDTVRTEDGDGPDETMVGGYRREYLPPHGELQNSARTQHLSEEMVKMILNLDDKGKFIGLFNFFFNLNFYWFLTTKEIDGKSKLKTLLIVKPDENIYRIRDHGKPSEKLEAIFKANGLNFWTKKLPLKLN